jgi:hypothetical protein
MSEKTPSFNIDPDGGMSAPAQVTYKGDRVEIVPPDTRHLLGNYWQIKIDGVLQRDLLFSSLRVAATQAKKMIDQEMRQGSPSARNSAGRLSCSAAMIPERYIRLNRRAEKI